MNFWEILELNPTDDRSAVRRAYARLLRKYHPEEDAEGFQRLRSAYEMAIDQIAFQEWLAGSKKESDSQDLLFEIDEPDSRTAITPASRNSTDIQDVPADHQHDSNAKALKRLLEKTEKILDSPNMLDRMECWESLFADPSLWNLDVKMEFSNRLFLLLYEKKCNDEVPFTMTFDVWRTIDDNLHWREREIQLYRMVDESKAHRVMDPIWRANQGSTTSTQLPEAVLKDIKREVYHHKMGFSWLHVLFIFIVVSSIGRIVNQSLFESSPGNFKKDQASAYSQFESGLESEKRGNYSDAAEWYGKAADRDYIDAQYHLGILYEQGKGVIQSYPKALKWYTKAARQGNPNAQYSLGLMYESGRGVVQDYVEAYMWLSLSIMRYGMNAEDAERHVQEILNKMTDQQRVKAQRLLKEWKPTHLFP